MTQRTIVETLEIFEADDVQEVLEYGIPGRDGAGIASNSWLDAISVGVLSGHRAVVVENGLARYPVSPSERVSGLTIGAALASQAVTVITCGPITEPSWNWNPGPVFVQANGVLTQSPGGDLQEIGLAVTPQTLIVRVQTPVIGA
jgi:hypothetical protein